MWEWLASVLKAGDERDADVKGCVNDEDEFQNYFGFVVSVRFVHSIRSII